MVAAGLWTSGSGTIHTPGTEEMFFLPQKPYMPLGNLRQQLLYPSGEAAMPEATMNVIQQKSTF